MKPATILHRHKNWVLVEVTDFEEPFFIIAEDTCGVVTGSRTTCTCRFTTIEGREAKEIMLPMLNLLTPKKDSVKRT